MTRFLDWAYTRYPFTTSLGICLAGILAVSLIERIVP